MLAYQNKQQMTRRDKCAASVQENSVSRCLCWRKICRILFLSGSFLIVPPFYVFGSSDEPIGTHPLPAIPPPSSLSPEVRARETQEREDLKKELATCKSQMSVSEMKLQKTQGDLNRLQEKTSRIEAERDDAKRAVSVANKEKAEMAAKLKLLQAELVNSSRAVREVRESPSPVVQAEKVSTSPASSTLGASFVEKSTGLEFVYILGNEYEMGDTFGEGGADERPVNKVRVESFYMGKYEVTQKVWEQVMGNNPSAFKLGGRYPVEQVAWEDVQEFIVRFNKLSGKEYRLPTEAEWEYAATMRRDGKKERYGTRTGELSRKLANYGANTCCSGDESDGFEHTAPVGSYPLNDLGLHDMSGNVWELTQDCYEPYIGAFANNHAGSLPACTEKVIRGGSWYSGSESMRATYRERSSEAGSALGFRLVLPLSSPAGS